MSVIILSLISIGVFKPAAAGLSQFRLVVMTEAINCSIYQGRNKSKWNKYKRCSYVSTGEEGRIFMFRFKHLQNEKS